MITTIGIIFQRVSSIKLNFLALFVGKEILFSSEDPFYPPLLYRSALESRRVSLGAHWVDSRESSLLRRFERGREIGR